MYVATHDAVSRVANVVLSKHAPRPPQLWYLQPDADAIRPKGLRPGEGLEEAIDRFDAATTGRNTGSRVKELVN